MPDSIQMFEGPCGCRIRFDDEIGCVALMPCDLGCPVFAKMRDISHGRQAPMTELDMSIDQFEGEDFQDLALSSRSIH